MNSPGCRANPFGQDGACPRRLTLGAFFNQPFDVDLPQNLKVLTFGEHFDQLSLAVVFSVDLGLILCLGFSGDFCYLTSKDFVSLTLGTTVVARVFGSVSCCEGLPSKKNHSQKEPTKTPGNHLFLLGLVVLHIFFQKIFMALRPNYEFRDGKNGKSAELEKVWFLEGNFSPNGGGRKEGQSAQAVDPLYSRPQKTIIFKHLPSS